jgi:hypothetical protein
LGAGQVGCGETSAASPAHQRLGDHLV